LVKPESFVQAGDWIKGTIDCYPGGTIMPTVCGIDIASKKFDYRIISDESEKIAKGTVPMDLSAFTNFYNSVPEGTFFVMESTGGYHLTCENFLRNQNAAVVVENPILIKRYIASQTLRRTKTDAADALQIARYGLTNYNKLQQRKSHMDEVNRTI
jgi:transposase